MNHMYSVELDEKLCVGCTACIKRCPTEAIRVRNGRAVILGEKCIDCGLCIKVCTHKAKKACTLKLSTIENYKYKVAIPAPSLYAQFDGITDVNLILTALKHLGFDDVFEVSFAAQAVTAYTNAHLDDPKLKKPAISSACPAVVRLISMRFPSLIGNVQPVIAPVEAAAVAAKNYLLGKGLRREEFGIFFISPCAAKHTYAIDPLGIKKTELDGVISMAEIHLAMFHEIRNVKQPEELMMCDTHGVDWALPGGESRGVPSDKVIAVDGVENVIQVLEELEDGLLEDVEFVEALACTGGCVGGPLTVTNSFVAKGRMRLVQKAMALMPEHKKRALLFDFKDVDFTMSKSLASIPSLLLDGDMSTAIKMAEQSRRIREDLPGIDCGSCGAPTCKALAEDIVRGQAHIEDCIFMLREKVRVLAQDMVNLSAKIPQTIRNDQAIREQTDQL